MPIHLAMCTPHSSCLLLLLSPVFSFWLPPPLWNLFHPSAFFYTCTSCCILTIASVLLCGPSAAALTHSQFCPSSKKGEKATSQNSPRFASLWGVSPCILLSFSFLPFFILNIHSLMMFSFHFFHHLFFLYFNLLLLFLFLFFTLPPRFFLLLLLDSPPFRLMAVCPSNVHGSFLLAVAIEGAWVLTLVVSFSSRTFTTESPP